MYICGSSIFKNKLWPNSGALRILNHIRYHEISEFNFLRGIKDKESFEVIIRASLFNKINSQSFGSKLEQRGFLYEFWIQ